MQILCIPMRFLWHFYAFSISVFHLTPMFSAWNSTPMTLDNKTLTNVADTNHGSLPCSIRVSSVASSGFRVLCVVLWQLNRAELAARERKERKRREMKWPLAIGDFVRCVRLVVLRPPKRFPSYPRRCHLFPSAPKRCQAIPKRFPNLPNPLFNRFCLKHMAIFRENLQITGQMFFAAKTLYHAPRGANLQCGAFAPKSN